MNNTSNLLNDNAGHILITLFSIITVASLGLISNSYAASTNTDLNNVFGCITQKANERSDLTLSDAFVCYDHNLKGASKFANQPFQNPDLSNLEAKPSISSDKAADKSTTPDSTSATTDPKASSKGATKTNDVSKGKDNIGTSDTTAKDKKDKSKLTADPFATKATDDTSKPTTTTTKTSSKDKPDASTSPLTSSDDPFATKATDDTSKPTTTTKTSSKDKPDASTSPLTSSDDPFATKATDDTSKPTTTTKTSSKDKPDINPSTSDSRSFDLPFSVIMPT